MLQRNPKQAEADGGLAEVVRATSLEKTLGGAYDAIVIGAGAAGGLAALLLCEASLRVLVLDAGVRRSFAEAPYSALLAAAVQRVATPETFARLPLPVSKLGRRALRLAGRWRQPVQSRCFAWEMRPDLLVDDRDNPYRSEAEGPFTWFRARQLGGRMVVPGHGRQYYRLSPADLEPPDGLSPPWPFASAELDPWYAAVERRLGLSGACEGHPWVPDSVITHQIDATAAERQLAAALTPRWPGLRPIAGRFAPPLPSLELAAATGRLACRQGAVVRQLHSDGGGRICGVSFVDDATGETHRLNAPLVFLCASALESTRILLLSRDARHPEGLGASSGALGRYLMDHVVMSGQGLGAALAGEPVPPLQGRSLYLPRFDLSEARRKEGRGFGVQLYRFSKGRGASFFQAVAFAEMTPRPDNRVVLDGRLRDRWGIPALSIRCRHSTAEAAQAGHQAMAIREIAGLLGVTLTDINRQPSPPGMAIHECGTARMGTSPEDSVLDPHNQCWDAQGLYVTDAASFPSQGAQNPTLTIMALTARAVDHALRATGRAATSQVPAAESAE
jgi:choline dehydrogenase-like flavoprotein